ncbi:hypothetical protein BDE36_0211 [Arcticibacter tournemirensis]|uniref:Uncharacterized protein n=1 Tax=Arcticibacter tournemirensis TaxID=699437 RepID=A0A5M9GK65_9SPHI|nr:hypothetical protein [Arcticibacter tournemirensis]KAA8474936.1 hypothetical protein F1649_21845 [Arcticibacter tournemirensis]TQM48527.1 hypothetical protein BDE36_0211 [Arcticibacter tournemirensis]
MKRIMLSLLVAATAAGVSAFTNAPANTAGYGQLKSGMISGNFLVNKGTSNFQQRASVDPLANCNDTDSRHCVYDVTASGKTNIPDQTSYSDSEVTTYLSNGWIAADADSQPALYDN